MCMNRHYGIEFLDEHLRTPGDKIMKDNIFFILSYLKITALERLCDIIHTIIYLLTRWLEGNRQILAD